MKREGIKPCILCGKGMANGNNLMFYQVRLTRFVINPGAVQRQAGLEMMLNSPALAQVMGPDENLAEELSKLDALVCATCAISRNLVVAELDEIISEKAAAKWASRRESDV